MLRLFQEQVAQRPNAPAIIDASPRRVTTFAQLSLDAQRLATLFHRTGLRSGDTVLVFQPMSAELYVILAAIFQVGLIAMFVDPAHGRAYLERCCVIQPPKAFIGSSKAHLLRMISSTLRRIPHQFVVGPWLPGVTSWQIVRRMPPLETIYDTQADIPALLTFTSGSTDQPKAVLRTHNFLKAQYDALVECLDLQAGQMDLATMPVVTLTTLITGGTCVIPSADLRYPGQIKPSSLVKQIQREQVTRTVASPALLERLATYCLQEDLTLPTMQHIFTGGGPVSPWLLERLAQIAPNAAVFGVYGSTEAEPIARVADDEIKPCDFEATLSGQGILVGKPVEQIKLKIIMDQWGTPIGPLNASEFSQIQCEAGQPGEIIVSGDHVLTGYLRGHSNEMTKFVVDGQIWHRTGDAGYLDDQSRLWLLGRCAARIDDTQGTIYPFAVESVASNWPGVKGSAVVSHRGKRRLLIEAERGYQVDASKLHRSLDWANLDQILLWKHIPVDKRHNAKIDYPVLHQQLDKHFG